VTFLPVAARELRVFSRRKRTYWMRLGTAFGVTAFGAFLFFVTKAVPVRGLGGQLGFCSLCVMLANVSIVLAGNTTECVAEEKREGTLGFLFLTRLKGYDVALAKLFSTSLTSFYCLLGALPVVAIFLLLGGVSVQEFGEVVLALLNVFFFAHSAALLVSTLGRHRTTVSLLFAAVLLSVMASFFFVPPLRAFHFDRIATLVLILSPFYCLYAACFTGLSGALGLPMAGGVPGFPTAYYWLSLAAVHLLVWTFVGVASWWLPRCWQESARPIRLQWRRRFQQWQYGSMAARTRRRARLISLNPFFWLISRNRLAPPALWGSLLLLPAVCCAGFFSDPDPGAAQGILVLFHLILLLGVGFCVNAQLGEQRRSGSLQLLLCSTPLTPPEILGAQWLALRRLFRGPFLIVLALDLGLILWSLVAVRPVANARASICVAVLAMILLIVDLVAAGWVAMWRAMLAGPRGRSAIETLGLLILLPASLLAGTCALLSFCAPALLNSFWFVQGLWFGIFVADALLFSVIARRKLLTAFRALVSTSPTANPTA